MKYTKRFIWLLIITLIMVSLVLPSDVFAKTSRIDEILSSMSNEEKIAQMIMPSFRKQSGVDINENNIKDILSTYNFAGVILFAENTPDVESTMRFVDLLQNANKNNKTRLLISIDQEGGYVTRLGIGTNMPGNMALAATNDTAYAYNCAKTIAKELKALGINTNFSPVVDVNSNPNNPVIGLRSFSDDPNIVAAYGKKFMQGLQSEGLITSLKHFPGHGDTSTDTHTGLAIINKTYEELKNNELIPFQELINSGTDMIMTAHIEYPNIEKETYVSNKDNNVYTLPATLSKKILTDILRKDMGYNGIIITDALDMKAISEQFGIEDASIKAINAGADILLMPYTYDSQINELKDYIKSLASKIGTEISEKNVNASVRRILKLKEEKGLLEEYDNSDLEKNITNAKKLVSSLKNHDEEFEIAKKAVTMVKNTADTLPLNTTDKTVILYEYASHINAVKYALQKLKEKDNTIDDSNITLYPFYNASGALDTDTIKNEIMDAKNVIMIHSLYGTSGMKDPDLDKMNELIDYVHSNSGKVVMMSTQLPYDIAKFTNADALVLTYLANGIKFNLEDYQKEVPKYGPNVMAGIYMLFTKTENMNGVLPINIYNIDVNNDYTNEILYSRNYGLQYQNERIEKKGIENNVGNADIINTSEEVKDKIELTQNENNAIVNGEKLYVLLEVNDISETVSNDDKKLVETKLEDDSVVGIYLDINLYKQIESEDKIKIEETTGKIKIIIEIPESLRNSNRKFYIIRVHGTEVTKIFPTISGNILTFETDKFSTYALIYTDLEKETIVDNKTNTSENNTTNQVTPSSDNNDTENTPDDNKDELNNNNQEESNNNSNGETTNTDNPSENNGNKETTNKEDNTNKPNKTISPNTYDNILSYVLLLIISSVTLIVIKKKYIIKK